MPRLDPVKNHIKAIEVRVVDAFDAYRRGEFIEALAALEDIELFHKWATAKLNQAIETKLARIA